MWGTDCRWHLRLLVAVWPCAMETRFVPSVGLVLAAARLLSCFRPCVCQASVGFIPAEPQLVRYPQAMRLPGFRRVYPGGATTGPLPSQHSTPSVESSTWFGLGRAAVVTAHPRLGRHTSRLICSSRQVRSPLG